MGYSVRTILEPATYTYHSHRQMMCDWPIANEFEWTQDRKRHDRIDKWNKAGLSQSSGDADHVLLGYANVEEAIGKLLCEWLERPETKIGGEEDDTRGFLPVLRPGLRESPPPP